MINERFSKCWGIPIYSALVMSACYDFSLYPRDGGAGAGAGRGSSDSGSGGEQRQDSGITGGSGGTAGVGTIDLGNTGRYDGGQSGKGESGSAGANNVTSGNGGTGGDAVISGGAGTTQAGTSGRAGGEGGVTTTGFGGNSGDPETGRLAGITAFHNAVRANVQIQTPLPALTWSSTLAAYAQEWTDSLATTCNPQHRSSAELQTKGCGENLAMFGGTLGSGSTAQKAVDGWAAEVDCYTYGKFMTTDKCDVACYTAMNSDGCSHYTQIVWRKTTEVGCGVSTCSKTGMNVDIWVCNYSPAGNYVGQAPY